MTRIVHKGRGKPPLAFHGREGTEMANEFNSFFCRFESDSVETSSVTFFFLSSSKHGN